MVKLSREPGWCNCVLHIHIIFLSRERERGKCALKNPQRRLVEIKPRVWAGS